MYLRDRDADVDGILDEPGAGGTTEEVDVAPDGSAPNNQGVGGYSIDVSNSGRYVAFESTADNISPDASVGGANVYRRDQGPARRSW